MKMKYKYMSTNIVGDLDKDDCCDRFQIMQNRLSFDYCIFNCLVYLFSEHVNGFFESHVLGVIVNSATNMFSCKEESSHLSLCILLYLGKFDFVELKVIDRKGTYVKSSIGVEGFNDCVSRAKKFCKEFEQVLDSCLDVFKQWIVYSEHKTDDS